MAQGAEMEVLQATVSVKDHTRRCHLRELRPAVKMPPKLRTRVRGILHDRPQQVRPRETRTAGLRRYPPLPPSPLQPEHPPLQSAPERGGQANELPPAASIIVRVLLYCSSVVSPGT